ncbi:hypothetical protein [Pantoea dispersa]|uniref:hypothetical protein n=1 Tax=Pantoea dispersa TaxID=59814 RepID=UPI000FD89C52|nr:hypothetical protein [Pantoea dispersa]MDI6632781.1 hypothetical protein [Pantoea dispersa]RVU74912.1 hypothetical protein EKH82_10390 [Pantoea dispersa]
MRTLQVSFALRRFNHVFSSSKTTTLREDFPVIPQRFCQISRSAIGLFAEYRDFIQVRINAHPAMPLRTAQSRGAIHGDRTRRRQRIATLIYL